MTHTPDILLYTMGHCPYCKRAKALLREKGITDWTEYDLEIVPERRAEMVRVSGRKTVPQIFFDGHHVGGASDLFALDDAGGLDPLLGLTPAS